MKTGLAILLTSLMGFVSAAQAQAPAQTEPMPKLIGYITLPNVEGWMDHLAVDVKGQRLFVPAEHQKTIEVVDLRAGKVIHTIDRQSKPGRRLYKKVDDLPKVLNGMGISIVSTSKGVMSDRRARESNVGGELLCTIS